MPQSPQVMNLSIWARWLFLGLILLADDEGRGSADPRKLKGGVFPGDDEITGPRVVDLLGEIERQGLVVTYDGNGHGRLYELPSFLDHQYIQRPKKSAYPSLSSPEDEKHSRTSNGRVPDMSRTSIGGSEGSEGSEGSQTRARAVDYVAVDKSRRVSARRSGRLKSDPEEIERRRSEAAAIAKRLAAGAKIP